MRDQLVHPCGLIGSTHGQNIIIPDRRLCTVYCYAKRYWNYTARTDRNILIYLSAQLWTFDAECKLGKRTLSTVEIKLKVETFYRISIVSNVVSTWNNINKSIFYRFDQCFLYVWKTPSRTEKNHIRKYRLPTTYVRLYWSILNRVAKKITIGQSICDLFDE